MMVVVTKDFMGCWRLNLDLAYVQDKCTSSLRSGPLSSILMLNVCFSSGPPLSKSPTDLLSTNRAFVKHFLALEPPPLKFFKS